jgi:hypothetical protein
MSRKNQKSVKVALTNAVKASGVVYDCGGELYHLECLRLEHGDDETLKHLRVFYKFEENLSPADASIRAGQFINDIERLKSNRFGFQQLRADIKALNNQCNRKQLPC